MSSAVIPPPAPEATPLSEGARLVNTFIAPSKTFTDLRRSAAWWAPFLLIAIVTIAFIYVVDKKVGFEKVTENQIQASAKNAQRFEQMPAVQRTRAIELQAKITRGISYGSWALALLIWLIIAAVLFGTLKLTGGEDLTFKASFAVVIYSALPGVLKAFLGIASMLAGINADSFNIENFVATNPGYFLSPAESPFLYRIGTAFDIFTIWTLILTAIGFACVGKIKRGTALAAVFGWYVFITLIGAGIAAAFS